MARWFLPYWYAGRQRGCRTSGNHVTKANRTFFIDGKEVGTAKEYSLDGMKLAINPFEGEIPQRFMWVKTGHKDSLDSRYELSGLIHSGQIIGKAVPIF
ncbi:S26 family signal peptidase [Neisseria gonorrhoeae]